MERNTCLGFLCMDREVCVYAGSGAVLARDVDKLSRRPALLLFGRLWRDSLSVEAALDRVAIAYKRVDEFDVKEGRLRTCSVLIFPGGYTESCVAALGHDERSPSKGKGGALPILGERSSEADKGVEVLAVYKEGSAAIVCSTYGEGRVVIFSPHPEGSLEAGIDPAELGTLKLLENAISFAQIGK